MKLLNFERVDCFYEPIFAIQDVLGVCFMIENMLIRSLDALVERIGSVDLTLAW